MLDFYHKLQDKSSEVVDDVGTQHEDTTVEVIANYKTLTQFSFQDLG